MAISFRTAFLRKWIIASVPILTTVTAVDLARKVIATTKMAEERRYTSTFPSSSIRNLHRHVKK